MNNDKLRILFLNKFYYLKGGSERVFFEEMAILQKHGHKLIPFSRRNPKNISSEYEAYYAPPLHLNNDISFSSLKTAIDIVYSQSTKHFLRKLIEKGRPQIAHSHNIYGILTTSVLDELHARGIPSVLSLHDYKIVCPNYQFLDGFKICEDCKTHRYYKAVQKKCVHGNLLYSCIYAFENMFNYLTGKYKNKVTKYIAVSRFIKNKFVEFGFPEEQIEFIPNFINTDNYNATYDDKHYFLYLGRLSREKGIQTLINAFKKLHTDKFKLVIVGDGPLRETLEQETSKSQQSRVEFTGFLSGDALAERIKNSTCVIVPSEWYENCPMSILESLAYGKPVIGAKIGGIPELIEHGKDGLIFESGDVNDLAAKMDHIAGLSSNELMCMGKNGRSKIEKEYNVEKHYDSLISLYSRILRN